MRDTHGHAKARPYTLIIGELNELSERHPHAGFKHDIVLIRRIRIKKNYGFF